MNDYEIGLTDLEAAELLQKHGENSLTAAKRKNPFLLFLSQFKDVLTVILAAATVFSVTVGEYTEAVSIIAIMLLNAVLGFAQEYRTEKTLERLADMSAPHAAVKRGGVKKRIKATEVVVGDLLLIEAGDRVPADARIVSAYSLEADEAILSGEAQPVPKSSGDRVFMGTSIVAGRGTARVEATGMKTEMGGIAGMIGGITKGRTPLEKRLARLGNQIAAGCLAICAGVAAIGVLRGERLLSMILMGLSLAVAAIPEGLPAVVTVVLALSVNRILKKNALIKRLHAVESLGCASVICCDKTGTITENKMTAALLYAAFTDAAPPGKINDVHREMLVCASLCTSAEATVGLGGVTFSGSPTETALLAAAAKYGIDQTELRRRFKRLAEQPFDSIRKYMSVTVAAAGGDITYIKGAFDRVAPMCGALCTQNGVAALGARESAAIKARAEAMAAGAFRVIAFAKKQGENTSFLGLVGLLDPPRSEVAPAVRSCRAMGIKTVMITGDMPETALAIAQKVGIDASRVITGNEMDAMDDQRLAAAAAGCFVFARVAPAHKLRLVRAYKALGMVTVMTGDGVNDAPAVKEADVGVAMGSTGTEVTKEAAGVIVLDDNFATIVAAVREGRVIYQNIQKFIVHLLTCNLGEVLTVLLGMLTGTPQIFIPVQLLLINLITDGLPAIALGMEPASENIDTDPPRKSSEGLVTKRMLAHMVTRGFVMAFCNLMSFMSVYWLSGSLEAARSAAYITLVLTQMAFVMRGRIKGKRLSNPSLTGAVLLSVAVTLITVYLPPLQSIFKTAPVMGASLAACAAATLLSPIIGRLFDRIIGK